MASKPRGDRSCVRAMKLPAALLIRSVSGPSAKDRLDHVVDAGGVADVDAVAHHLAAMRLHQLGCGIVAHELAAAADVHFGAECKELFRHRLAKAGAAAGDENPSAFEKIGCVHDDTPATFFVNWLID